jgi:IMP dehydrogenase
MLRRKREVKDQVKLVPEDIEGQVPYRGLVGAIVHEARGGLRA